MTPHETSNPLEVFLIFSRAHRCVQMKLGISKSESNTLNIPNKFKHLNPQQTQGNRQKDVKNSNSTAILFDRNEWLKGDFRNPPPYSIFIKNWSKKFHLTSRPLGGKMTSRLLARVTPNFFTFYFLKNKTCPQIKFFQLYFNQNSISFTIFQSKFNFLCYISIKIK